MTVMDTVLSSVSVTDCGAWDHMIEFHRRRLHVYRESNCDTALGMGCTPLLPQRHPRAAQSDERLRVCALLLKLLGILTIRRRSIELRMMRGSINLYWWWARSLRPTALSAAYTVSSRRPTYVSSLRALTLPVYWNNRCHYTLSMKMWGLGLRTLCFMSSVRQSRRGPTTVYLCYSIAILERLSCLTNIPVPDLTTRPSLSGPTRMPGQYHQLALVAVAEYINLNIRYLF